MFAYYVSCQFAHDSEQTAAAWLDWLENEHIADVIACGATEADIVLLDGEPTTYEIRYQFESRAAFEEYERKHAPRLRKEGLEKFPLELGLSYQRRTGEIVFKTS